MGFDPNHDRYGQLLSAPLIEYLACQPARDASQVLAILTFRFVPACSFISHNFSLTKAQVMRLRDDLNSVVSDPDSWLFGKE